MNKKRRLLLGWLLILGFIFLGAAYLVLFKGNTTSSDGTYFYIKSSDSYERMRENLIYSNVIDNVTTFDLVAKQLELSNSYKPGRYKIEEGMSNLDLVRLIRSGGWEKVVIKVKSEMTRDSLLNYLSANLETTKNQLIDYMDSDWAEKNGFSLENIWCIFLPDHYHFNWATPANEVAERFLTEYNRYWTEERLQKANELNLSPAEVCILASIVDGEAIHNDEMPTIAGLYLNRINKGMFLQADPTILYVVGREGRRRVLHSDLKRNDPYNTYLNLGLPPGPIFLPDKRAIDAVLSPKQHNFIYMCAKPDGSYRHNFTASAAQHLRNAAAYRRSLNRQGIMR